MIFDVYESTSPVRTRLRAAFEQGTSWGEERGGHLAGQWDFVGTLDLDQASSVFPLEEAVRSIEKDGIYLFQTKATELDLFQHATLNIYRLKFTLPLFSDSGRGLALLGTGTLFEHEDRHFIVTADHVFRTDPECSSSPLIDMTTIAVPSEPKPAGSAPATMFTIGSHSVFRLKKPVTLDVIVIELLDPTTISTLEEGWKFLTFDQAEDVHPQDDRFVITGFLAEGLTYDRDTDVIGQSMLNLETDYFPSIPNVKEPAPGYDLFFHLQREMTNVDGSKRTVESISGLSGGPIWAVRHIPNGDVWTPGRAMKIVAIQSSELQSAESWSRGFRWSAVQGILRQPEVGFRNPP